VTRSRNLSTITRDWNWPLSLVSNNIFLKLNIKMYIKMYTLCICLSHTPLVVFIYIYIYIDHLINDMKLESSQFIYYPKRAELLFAWVDLLSIKLFNWSSQQQIYTIQKGWRLKKATKPLHYLLGSGLRHPQRSCLLYKNKTKTI
jgi:hypothetical protein